MGRKTSLGTTLLLFCAMLFACQTLPPGMALVKEPAQRFVLKDFSVSAPTGGTWYAQMQGEDSILFYQGRGSSSGHTIVAGVKPFVPPFLPRNREELESLIKDSLEKEQENSERFRDPDLEILPDSRFGEYSILLHCAVKDYTPTRLPSDAKYLILKIYAYYLRLPKGNTYLHVWYSERSKQEDQNPAFAEQAGSFFSERGGEREDKGTWFRQLEPQNSGRKRTA